MDELEWQVEERGSWGVIKKPPIKKPPMDGDMADKINEIVRWINSQDSTKE